MQQQVLTTALVGWQRADEEEEEEEEVRVEGRVFLRYHQSWSKSAHRLSKEVNVTTGDDESLAALTCVRSQKL